jgi:hypothetical protein
LKGEDAMKVALAYEFTLGERVEVFAETGSRALDYAGSFPEKEATLFVRDLLGQASILDGSSYAIVDRGRDLYRARKQVALVRVIGDSGDSFPAERPEIQAFFVRYALAVVLRFPGREELEYAGYIGRDLAAILRLYPAKCFLRPSSTASPSTAPRSA